MTHDFLIKIRVLYKNHISLVGLLGTWMQLNNSSNWGLHHIYRASQKNRQRLTPVRPFANFMLQTWVIWAKNIKNHCSHTILFRPRSLKLSIFRNLAAPYADKREHKRKKNLLYYKLIIWVTLGRFWLIFKMVTKQ